MPGGAAEEGRTVGEIQLDTGAVLDDPIIWHIGAALLPALERPEKFDHLFLEHVAVGTIAFLAQRYGPSARTDAVTFRGGLSPRQERRVKELSMSCLDGATSLDEIARECGVSRSHLTRAFKRCTADAAPLAPRQAHRPRLRAPARLAPAARRDQPALCFRRSDPLHPHALIGAGREPGQVAARKHRRPRPPPPGHAPLRLAHVRGRRGGTPLGASNRWCSCRPGLPAGATLLERTTRACADSCQMLLRKLSFLLPQVPPREAAVRWLAFVALVTALWVTLFGIHPGGNLARGKSVRASGPCKRAPENTWLPVTPARLVDGKKWRPFDGCVDTMANPWVTVDLRQPSLLREVVTTGRRDCCWNYESLPLVLELSADGEHFQEAARRSVPISDRDPWRVPLAAAPARYVRLRVASEAAAIALSEIEVFGEPAR